MKNKLLLGLFVFITFNSCSDKAELDELINEESLPYDGILIPIPKTTKSTASVQSQKFSFNFGEPIEIAYTASQVNVLDFYLVRTRYKDEYDKFQLREVFNGASGLPSREEIKIGSLSFTEVVNSGIVSFEQPANLYYDREYSIQAYSNTTRLATSDEFEIGNPALDIGLLENGDVIEEDQKNILRINSNFDPAAIMVIEISKNSTVYKRFLTNNIESDRQTWFVSGRNENAIYESGLVGSLKNLNLGFMNPEILLPPQEKFSSSGYMITVYPIGYDGISSSRTNLRFVEKKFDAWDNEFKDAVIKMTSFGNGKINFALNWWSLTAVQRNFDEQRWDLYKNGEWYKKLDQRAASGWPAYILDLNDLDDPNARWDIRLTAFMNPTNHSSGGMFFYDMENVNKHIH